jgi:predicted tellurium resistance membrane protein TerC
VNRVVIPLLIPLTAMIVAGAIIFTISRILLSFSPEVTPPVALAIALVILVGASLVAARVSTTNGA